MRYALGTSPSRSAAHGPMGGCGAAAGPGRKSADSAALSPQEGVAGKKSPSGLVKDLRAVGKAAWPKLAAPPYWTMGRGGGAGACPKSLTTAQPKQSPPLTTQVGRTPSEMTISSAP